jgi:hypothetical protein
VLCWFDAQLIVATQGFLPNVIMQEFANNDRVRACQGVAVQGLQQGLAKSGHAKVCQGVAKQEEPVQRSGSNVLMQGYTMQGLQQGLAESGHAKGAAKERQQRTRRDPAVTVTETLRSCQQQPEAASTLEGPCRWACHHRCHHPDRA